MNAAQRWLEALSPAAFWGGGASIVGAPVLAGLAIGDPWMWGGAALSALAIPMLGTGAWVRHRASRLPLVLSAKAVRGRLDGCPAFWCRASLGRGRLLRDASARARWVCDGGDIVELEVLAPRAAVLVGPWTMAVIDRAGITADGGSLEVVVEGREGSRAWSAAGQYAAGAIREGRFQPPVERRRGRLCVRADWDEVQLTSA